MPQRLVRYTKIMISVLTGPNIFLLRAELQRRVQVFVHEYSNMAYEQLDGEEVEYSRIAEAVQSLPFLAARKLVVLRSPGTNKQFMDTYETLLADIPEITDVLIVEPRPDKRTTYYKWLKKQLDFQEFAELDENDLIRWTASYAKEQGSSIATSEAQYLLARVGTSQERLAHEIEKLALAGTAITKQAIDDLTEQTPQSKIFDLLDAAWTGNTKRALELYQEQRVLKVEPQEIIGMLGWQLRQVALAKTAGSHDLVREGKVSPYSANKAKKIANRLSLRQLRQQVRDLATIDARSKREPLDLDEALQNYLLKLS